MSFEERAQQKTAKRLLKDGWTAMEMDGQIIRIAPSLRHCPPDAGHTQIRKILGVIWEMMK